MGWLAMMLAAALPLSQAALPLDELPPQVMAKNSCALFLWDRASARRVEMMVAVPGPAYVRVARGGTVVALPQISAEGDPVLGFAPRAKFGDAAMTLAFDLTVVANDGAVGGGIVRDGVMTVTGADGVAVVAPVAGLVGCN